MNMGLSCPIHLSYQGKNTVFQTQSRLFVDYAKTGHAQEKGLREAAFKLRLLRGESPLGHARNCLKSAGYVF
ncbi:hypothetical protein [Thalassospira sp.]|uniref:hypothetical protein n=1 Tax=Thalassospira sp. TaxID=1912094 RepID=UPI003AA8A281